MNYIPIQCKTAIHKISEKKPFHYDVNIYRGCEHGCLYCYALYSHRYLNDSSFYQNIYYKENIIEVLEKELSSPRWKKEVINFGGVCDSYQPCEKELGLMRDVLKLMIKYKNPINISTKSSLILRDLDLLQELSKITYVNITSTITTADETIQKIIEPHASSSYERMKTLQMIKQKTNATVGILMMPIIPYITDHYENLEAIYKLASQINLDYIITGTLYLRGQTKVSFFYSIKKYDGVSQKLKNLYKTGSCDKEYKKTIDEKINKLKEIYNL